MKTRDLNSGYQLIQILGGRSNAYLLSNGESFVLIDNGRLADRKLLLKNLIEIIGNWKDLKYLLLTHSHFDHCSNTAYIKDKSGASLIVHKNESKYLQNGFTPLPKGTLFFTRLLSLLPKPFKNSIASYPPVVPDTEITQTYRIPDENWDIILLPTPGHTEGSLSIIVNDEIALVGDLLFGVQNQKIFPPFANNPQRLLKSWELLLETECEWFFPGHGKPVTRSRLEEELEKLKKAQK